MIPEPPWSAVGALQGEVQRLQSQIYEKADTHEIRQVRDALARLERTIGEVRASCDGLGDRLQALENQVSQENAHE